MNEIIYESIIDPAEFYELFFWTSSGKKLASESNYY
jgi:hypothetical protein